MLLIEIGILVLNVILMILGMFGVFLRDVVRLYVFLGGVVYGFFNILYLLVWFYRFWLMEYGLLRLIGIGMFWFVVYLIFFLCDYCYLWIGVMIFRLGFNDLMDILK